MLPMLLESFGNREAENLFKFTLEDFFNKRYILLKDYSLTEDEIEQLNYIFEKISNHFPLQYIFNKAYFYDLVFYVDENVLIPRQETEELVHLILSQNQQEASSVVDIGTGSGCIAIALKKNRPMWNIYAIDISDDALTVAQKNAVIHQTMITFYKRDILHSVENFEKKDNIFSAAKFDIIVSNPPYISFDEQDKMSESTLLHEPHLALFVEHENPLLFYDKIADFALRHLNPNGQLFFELNEFNADDVKDLLEQKGFTDVHIYNDLSGKQRMIKALKK